MARASRRFAISDLIQQIVGGFLLAGPFVVTEEVWLLASNMSGWHALLANIVVLTIGYGSLYHADRERDPEKETSILGIPLRFLSLMLVTYSAVIILTYLFAAPTTFEGGAFTAPYILLKVVSIASIFSVVGAATADSVF